MTIEQAHKLANIINILLLGCHEPKLVTVTCAALQTNFPDICWSIDATGWLTANPERPHLVHAI